MIYDYTITTGKGQELNLSDYRGKVIMVVNTATGCGFTPQYVPIEQVYRDNSKLFEDGNGNIIPFEKIRSPLRDGDTDRPGDTYFAGCCFLNAYSFSAPVVVDANKQLITNENLLSSGMTGRAVLTFYPYNRGGNAGIGAGLEGVQKLGDNRRSAILAEFE